MADKQQLNGAYYGPSIPPPPPPHRPHSRRCILVTLISVIAALGLAALIFWLVVRPAEIKFHVTGANLSQFSLDSGNNLRYNLALNITVRNPNKKIGVYYDRIEARGYYEGERFGFDSLSPFYQGHKNTTVLTPVLQGQQLLVLSGDEVAEFNGERSSGIYSIDVKLYLKVRFKVGDIKVGKFKPKIECDIKVPVNGTAGFETTRCDWDY